MDENHQEKSLGEILVAWFRSEGVSMDDWRFIPALDLTIANAVSDALKDVNDKIADVNRQNRERHDYPVVNPSATANADMVRPIVVLPATEPASLAPAANSSPQDILESRDDGCFSTSQACVVKTAGKAPT